MCTHSHVFRVPNSWHGNQGFSMFLSACSVFWATFPTLQSKPLHHTPVPPLQPSPCFVIYAPSPRSPRLAPCFCGKDVCTDACVKGGNGVEVVVLWGRRVVPRQLENLLGKIERNAHGAASHPFLCLMSVQVVCTEWTIPQEIWREKQTLLIFLKMRV